MELLLITATRLKIVMSNEDMEKYEITCDSLDYRDSDTKRAIRNILDEAKQKIGFDTQGKHVFVQVFPSKDGGCEMYVTKTPTAPDNALPVPVHNNEKQTATIFRFKNTSDMMAVCCHLQAQRQVFPSQAFCDREGDACYLVLYSAGKDVFGRDPMYLSVANEYGSLVKGDYCSAYLKEHCQCICDADAISILAALR